MTTALEPDELRELIDLAERQLAELRALREETAQQSELLKSLLERLTSLERSQYS